MLASYEAIYEGYDKLQVLDIQSSVLDGSLILLLMFEMPFHQLSVISRCRRASKGTISSADQYRSYWRGNGKGMQVRRVSFFEYAYPLWLTFVYNVVL
jgi:hypothetical protein